MRKWIPILMAAGVIAACFYPWVIIESRNLVISGFSTSDYGKPGLMHCFIAGLYILFLLIYKAWSVRAAFFLSVLNLAWFIRNFLLISSCSGGECPQKQTAFYILLAGSVLMTVSIFFVKIGQGTAKPEGRM